MLPPLCSMCGTKHHAHQAHVFATNKVSATNTDATNNQVSKSATELRSGSRIRHRPQDGREDIKGKEAAGRRVGPTKNRRSREDYNAYQREYMKKRRAKNLPL